MTAISPLGTNDFILDVIRAADPMRAKAAMARLGATDNGASFSSSVVAAKLRSEPPTSSTVPALHQFDLLKSGHKTPVNQTIGQSFESAVLRPLIESLLASGPSNAFGSGLAGSSFRGLFSEQIASQLAQSGAIGVARLIDLKLSAQDDAVKVMSEIGEDRAVST